MRIYYLKFLIFISLLWAGFSCNDVIASESIVLEADGIKYAIDSDTGDFLGQIDGVLDVCSDNYIWFDKSTKIKSSSKKDKVKSLNRSDDGKTITIVCYNDPTKITVTKRYTIQESPKRLLKRVSFAGPKGFIRYEPQIHLDKRFRRGSYYQRVVWHSSEPTRINCSDVRSEVKMGNPGVIMVNRSRNQTVAAYFEAVDDKFVFHEEAGWGSWALTKYGWRMSLLVAVRPDYQPSITVAYEVRSGTELDFHLDMSTRSELLKLYGDQPEGWGKEIALEAGWDSSYTRFFHKIGHVADRLPWGYMLWTHWGWFAPYYGDYAYDKKDAAEGTKDPAEIAELFRQAKRLSSNIKVGAYILPGKVSKSSRFAKDHPEWLMYDQNNKPYYVGIADYARKDPTYRYSILAPGVLEHWKDRIRGILEHLGADYIYTDGGVGGGGHTPDFARNAVAEHYDWCKLWKAIHDISHEFNGIYMVNGTAGVFNDIGYHELNWYLAYLQDWKDLTNRLKYGRIYSRPGRPLCMVGFVWDGTLEHPATRVITNLYFVHNLTPCFLDNKGENHAPAIESALPYISAAFQIRTREVVQANVSPEWEDEYTDIEVHAQKIEGAGLLSILNHGEEQKYTIQADTKPFGLKKQPLYVWKHVLRVPDELKDEYLEGTEGIKKCFDSSMVKFLDKTPKRMQVEIAVPEDRAVLLTATNSPALVVKVGSKECPIPLPSTFGVETSGFVDNYSKNVNLNVKASGPGELIVLPPEGYEGDFECFIRPTSGSAQSPIDGGKPLKFKFVEAAGQRMINLSFPKGESEIIIKSIKGNQK